jgi:putative hydrolase of the HAD superfamily
MIRTLLVDADGVLQHGPFGWRAGLLRRTGASWEEISAVEDPLMTGRLDVGAAFEAGFARRTVGVEELIEYWNHTVVDAVALALLDAVRARGVRVALASNQQPVRARHMREVLPYRDHLDALFFSCEVGLAKPDPAFFVHVVGCLDTDPDETLFIDDMPENAAGARTAGLHAESIPTDTGAAGLRRVLERHGLLG